MLIHMIGSPDDTFYQSAAGTYTLAEEGPHWVFRIDGDLIQSSPYRAVLVRSQGLKLAPYPRSEAA